MMTRVWYHKNGVKIMVTSLFFFGTLAYQAFAPVGPPPVINTQPVDQIVNVGETAAFSVDVTSATNPTFKWYKDGVAIPSAVTATYTVEEATLADAGVYWVEVRNTAGTVTSSNAVLKVLVPPTSFTVAAMTTNGFYIQFSAATGATYVIQASTNLQNWVSVSTNVATTNLVEFIDTTAVDLTARYYRVAR